MEWKRTDKTEFVTFLTNTVGPDIVDEQVVVTLLWYDRDRCVCVCVCVCV